MSHAMSNESINFPATDNGNPRHIAIIMDGNGRWAQRRLMPRVMGHRSGVKAVRKTVEHCARNNIEVLSLFAFSSENWRRPLDEVSLLMDLFMATLQAEIDNMMENNIRLLVIGDKSAFSEKLQERIRLAEAATAVNTGLTLVIAANYGGRWDIAQAARRIAHSVRLGEIGEQEVSEALISRYLVTDGLPEPDLFIRTGGEERISNFLLWQLAYTEFYFTDLLWPDFDEKELGRAIDSFKKRQRRFGFTGDQIQEKKMSG